MATTTVRLDSEDEALLDLLAGEYGGRSGAIRHAIRALGADRQRQILLAAFLSDWEAEAGPVTDDEVSDMAARYGL